MDFNEYYTRWQQHFGFRLGPETPGLREWLETAQLCEWLEEVFDAGKTTGYDAGYRNGVAAGSCSCNVVPDINDLNALIEAIQARISAEVYERGLACYVEVM